MNRATVTYFEGSYFVNGRQHSAAPRTDKRASVVVVTCYACKQPAQQLVKLWDRVLPACTFDAQDTRRKIREHGPQMKQFFFECAGRFAESEGGTK